MKLQDAMTVVTTHEYVGLNRRIVRDETGGSGDKRHFYYNDEWQALEERVEAGATIDPQPINEHVWHPYYIDALAVRYYDSNTDGSGIVRHWYLQDANFNVTAVVEDDGDVLERYRYSPYGEPTVLDADFATDVGGVSDIGNNYLYTGRERDPESGLQLNRHRFYHAGLGRWLTRDPIGYEGGMNLYGYVGSRPTFVIDPLGLWWWDKPKACCNGTPYDPETQCCEDGKIVAKVSIWICKRPLDIDPWKIGVCDFFQFDWLMPGEDADVSHSYVCCDGPNRTCFGLQAKQPDPDGDGPLEPPWTCKGDPITPEPLAVGDCIERRVCPKVWDIKCNNPISDRDYSIRKGDACHGWAWECVPYWSWE